MQRGVAQARGALYKEINIPEIIKLHRFLKLSLLYLLPPEKLKEINKRASSTIIDPDRDSDDKQENLITDWNQIVNEENFAKDDFRVVNHQINNTNEY